MSGGSPSQSKRECDHHIRKGAVPRESLHAVTLRTRDKLSFVA